MKKTRILPLLLASLSLTWGNVATTLADQNRFYVKLDAGGTSAQDVTLREYFGQPIAPNSELELDPGIRLGLHAGYGITDWLDAELETGVSANSVESITGAFQSDAVLSHVPALLNVRLHVPDGSRVSPYAGAGLGLSTTILSADDIIIGPTIFSGSAADVVFAWQAFAGLNVAINEHMNFGVEYRFFRAEAASLEVDDFIGVPPPSDRIRLGRSEVHSLSVSFTFRF